MIVGVLVGSPIPQLSDMFPVASLRTQRTDKTTGELQQVATCAKHLIYF
jgi:hypothetical protein